MNPIDLEALEKAEAHSPIKIESPWYTLDLVHRFGRFTAIANDGFQTGSVALYGDWAHEESLILEALLEPGNWVLDLGANTGSLTLAFAAAVGEKGKIFAFEPQPLPFQCLVSNIVRNSLSHYVLPFRAAIGEQEGEILCPILDARKCNNFGGCSLVDPDLHGEHVEPVPLMTIDSLHLPACHLIKADIEGMESDALKGAFQTISKFRPSIWAEQLDSRKNSRQDLLAIFLEHDYRAWRIVTPIFSPRNIRRNRVNPYRFPDGSAMVDTNILALPKEHPACESLFTWLASSLLHATIEDLSTPSSPQTLSKPNPEDFEADLAIGTSGANPS